MVEIPSVEVRRSRRRTRTLSVFREGTQLVALIPERMSPAQEATMVPELVARFLAKEARRLPPPTDQGLARRAVELYREYLEPILQQPLPDFTVTWVDNQNHRWGSCTSATGAIRLSSRLRTMPNWVIDQVLLHEVAHLFVPNHSEKFRHLESRYPHRDRAMAFLDGYQHAQMHYLADTSSPDAASA